jgi:hypothetical protein
MPAIARDVAKKRALRANKCWNQSDEARLQRITEIQKYHIRSIAAACVIARNPGAVQQVRYPTRCWQRD